MASKRMKKLLKIAVPVAALAVGGVAGGAVGSALSRAKAAKKKMSELKNSVDVEKVFKLKKKSGATEPDETKTPSTSGTIAASAGFRLSPFLIIGIIGAVLVLFFVMKR